METVNIRILEDIPYDLINHHNIKCVCINGITYEIREVVNKAKYEAKQLVKNGYFFYGYTKSELEFIIENY
jgi:hypothetical protein